jgi:hypothetical protein
LGVRRRNRQQYNMGHVVGMAASPFSPLCLLFTLDVAVAVVDDDDEYEFSFFISSMVNSVALASLRLLFLLFVDGDDGSTAHGQIHNAAR